MTSFAYSVAIRLQVANLASQGVRLLAADLLKAHGAATNLQSKLSALKMIAVGYGLDRAGEGILGFMNKAVDASKEYTHQLALMNAAGFTQKEVAESTAAAWKTAGGVITTTAAQNLEVLRELRSAFGKGEGMAHAYAVLPQVQRVSSILRSLTGREQAHVGFDMVKAIELGTKGALSVESMMRQSEMMSKALVQMGGTLTVSDFHQAIKYSRAMAPYMTDEFKYLYLPTLMQEMKAGPSGGATSAGNVIASLGQVVVGQQIPKALIQNWIDSGLINAGSVVKDKHNRTTSKVMPGGVVGQNEFGENPYFWAQKYAAPAVDKLMRERHLDQYGAILALTHNRVAAFGLQTLINKGAQFERDRKLIAEGPTSYDTYQRLMKADPQMAEQALHSQWQNLLAILGYQILPRMIPYMVKFADGLDRISQWMAAHPTATRDIAFGLVGIGAALSVIGKAMMAVGIIRFLGMGPALAGAAPVLGTLVLSLAAAGVIAVFVYKNWDKLTNIATALNAQFPGMVQGFNNILWFIGQVIDKASYLNPLGLLGRGAQVLVDAGDQWANDGKNPKIHAVRPAPQWPAQNGGNVYLDSYKVGKVMSHRQNQEAGRPNVGSGRVNYAAPFARQQPGSR